MKGVLACISQEPIDGALGRRSEVARRAPADRRGYRGVTGHGFFGLKACRIAVKVPNEGRFAVVRTQVSRRLKAFGLRALRPAVGMLAWDRSASAGTRIGTNRRRKG